MFREPGFRSHQEAYPRLNVREAHKHVSAGRSLVTWRNQHDAIVGYANARIVTVLEVLCLELTYKFIDIPYVLDSSGTVFWDLTQRKLRRSGPDCSTTCAPCKKDVRLLIFNEDTWACRSCKGLGYRSQIIGERARRSERLKSVERQICNGRPAGMHQSSYDRLVAEHVRLDSLVGLRRTTPSAALLDLLEPRWSIPATFGNES